jgi:TonB family protein
MIAYVLLLAAATPEPYPVVDVPRKPDVDCRTITCPSANPPSLNYSKPPRPIGNPGSWIGEADYPNIAIQNLWEGLVGFRLTVNSKGTVDKCEVTSSSNYPELDAAACYLITARARFEPAQDTKGNPEIGYYSNRVRWQMPDLEDPLPVSETVKLSYVIDETGLVENCTVTHTPPRDDAEDCEAETWIFEPPVGKDGKPARKRVEAVTVIKVMDEVGGSPASKK